MKKKLMAVYAVLAAVVFTVAYRKIAGWDSAASWIGAGLVVCSWLVLLYYAPVLIGMLRELMSPLAIEVRRGVGRHAIKAGLRIEAAGKRVYVAGLLMLIEAKKKTVEG